MAGAPARRGCTRLAEQQAVAERQDRRRRRRAELVAQQHPQLVEDAHGLRDVAACLVDLHQQRVAGLAKRLAARQLAGGALALGELVAADPQGRGGLGLEQRAGLLLQLAPALVTQPPSNSGSSGRSAISTAAGRPPSRSRLAALQRGLRVGHRLLDDHDVDHGVVAELQRQVGAPDQRRADHAAQARQQHLQRGLGRGRRVGRPQDLDELGAADGPALRSEVGQQQPALASGEIGLRRRPSISTTSGHTGGSWWCSRSKPPFRLGRVLVAARHRVHY